MKQIAYHRGQGVDIAAEPITREMKTCILTELVAHPGSRIVKRHGRLLFVNGRFEYSVERLCESRPYRRQ